MVKVLMAVVGPTPMPYGTKGRTTRDDMLELAEESGSDFVCIRGRFPGEPGFTEKYEELPRINNEAVGMALEGGYSHLMALANDARVRPGMMDALLAHEKDVIVPQHCFVPMPSLTGWFNSPTIQPDSPNPFPINWAAGGVLLLSRRLLEMTAPDTFHMWQENQEWGQWRTFVGPTYMALDVTADILQMPHAFCRLAARRLEAHGDCQGWVSIIKIEGTYRGGICRECSAKIEYDLDDALALPLPEDYE